MESPEGLDNWDFIAADVLGGDAESVWEQASGLHRMDYMPAFVFGLAERYVDVIE